MTQGMTIQFLDKLEMGQVPPERIVKGFLGKVEGLLKKYKLGEWSVYGECLEDGGKGPGYEVCDFGHYLIYLVNPSIF